MNVAFHPSVIDYLDQLAFTLYEKEYFGLSLSYSIHYKQSCFGVFT